MANNNNSNQFDDPSFQTQKLPKDTSSVDQMFDRAKPSGTEDKRVKAMEEAVKKAKSKQQVSGASTKDDYADSDERETSDHQKVVNTIKLKRGKNVPPPPQENPPDMTMKLKNISDDEADDEGSSLLGWQHWLLLLGAVGVTVAAVYLLLLP